MKMRYSILIAAAIFLLASVALADSQLERLHLKRVNGETVLKIDVKGPFQFAHKIEDAKDGKPFRVIVDIFPTVHNLGQKIFAALPPSIVTAIRTSQFAVTPEKTARVVLDLKESAVYRVEKSGEFLFVYVPDPAHADFPEWASSAESTGATPTVVVKPAAEKKVVIIAEQPKSEPPQESKPEVKTPVTVASRPPVAEKKLLAVEEQPKTEAKTPVTVTATPAAETPEVVAQPKPTPPISLGTKARQSSVKEKELAAEKATPAGRQQSTPTQVPAEKETKAAPELATVATQHQTPSKPNPAPAVAPESKPVDAVVSDKATDKSKSEPIPAAPAAAEKAEVKFDSMVDTAALAIDDLPAIDTTDDAADKPTSRFRRDPIMPTKLKGTIVAEFPQRMVIDYAPGIFRDPFESLIEDKRPSNDLLEDRIPDVETSRLVGILESSYGKNRALLEDIDGYGYILKPGDKVKKGFVERIESDKAFFQLFEYGWSRTIALFLGITK